MQTPVIVSRLSNPASNAVFEKVRDWTISGLVSDSYWFDIAEPSKILRLRSTGVEKLDAAGWAGTFTGEMRLISMQALKSPGSAFTEGECSSALSTVDPFLQPSRHLVNVIFPLATTKDASGSYFERKLNLVALPFDGFAPNDKGQQIGSSSPSYFSNCAKELVTIAGMWPGQSASVLDGLSFVPGSESNIVIERSFIRYVDASNFVKSVINKVIDVEGDALPTPVDATGKALNVVTGEEAKQSVRMVADMFVATHPQLKFNQFPNQFGRAPIGASIFKLLGYYFSWVGRWLIRQPANILQKAIADRKLAMAKSVQDLFGSKSQFMVLVGGVSAHEYPDGIPMAANSIMETVQSQLDSPVKPAPAAPAMLWKDMVEVAVSLGDGAPINNAEIIMPGVDGYGRTIVKEPSLITPNYLEKSFDIPASLNVPFKGHRLSASDPLTARLVQEQLDASLHSGSVDNNSIAAVGKLQQELMQWRASNRSFVWSVGDHLSNSIYEGLKVWEDLSSQVTDIDDSKLVAAEAKAQKSLTRLFKGVFLIIGASLLAWGAQALFVFMTYGAWPVVASWWAIPTTIVGVLILLWNIIGLVLMHGAVKELFRLEHELEKANERLVYAKKAKAHIWTEISRLTTFYQQYQAWVAILSSFVHRNSGKDKASTAGDTIAGAQSLPQSMTIAQLLPDLDGDDKDMSKKVSAEYYQVGWLGQLMEEILNKQVTTYNAITTDSMATPSTPLALALAWSKNPSSIDAIREHATEKIQALAISGTAYQSWKVQLTNAIGDKEITNGSDLIGKLGFGEDYLPAAFLLSPIADTQGAAKIDRSQSAVGFDQRLSPQTDLSKRIAFEKNHADSRSLDFLGIRFEVSGMLSKNDLNIFGKEVEADKPLPPVGLDVTDNGGPTAQA